MLQDNGSGLDSWRRTELPFLPFDEVGEDKKFRPHRMLTIYPFLALIPVNLGSGLIIYCRVRLILARCVLCFTGLIHKCRGPQRREGVGPSQVTEVA